MTLSPQGIATFTILFKIFLSSTITSRTLAILINICSELENKENKKNKKKYQNLY